MAVDPLTAVLSIGNNLIDKLWPDPIKRAEEKRKLEELHRSGESEKLDAAVELMLAQIKLNTKEAGHQSIFVAGWRPGIGWVGVTALAYQFIGYPTLLWLWAILEVKGLVPEGVTPPPAFDAGQLGTIITGMLGMGGLRSLDKRGGVQTDSIK